MTEPHEGQERSAASTGRRRAIGLSHIRPLRRRLALAVAVAGVGAVAEAVALVSIAPLAQAVAADDERFVGSVGPVRIDLAIGALAAGAAVAVLVSVVFNSIAEVVRGRTVAAWERDVRYQLVDSYLGATWSTQSSERAGAVQEVAGTYVSRGGQGLAALLRTAKALVSLVVLLLVALVINLWAAVAIVLCGGLLFGLLRPTVAASRRYAKVAADTQLEVASEIAEVVASAREIRVFGAGPSLMARIADRLDRFRVAEGRSLALGGMVSPLYQGLGLFVLVGILFVAARQPGLDVAALGAVALLLLRSFSFGQQLIAHYQRLQETRVYFDGIDSMLSRHRTARARSGDTVLEDVSRIELRDVSYTYDGVRHALAGVNLTLPKGEIVGLAGPSGSGKSTLAELVLRLRSPSEGLILADGIDIHRFEAGAWTRAIALVPQQVHLAHGTVAENVTYFRPWIGRTDIEAGLEAAGLSLELNKMGLSHETLLGPSVRALSGGQVQRLGIARALAGRPKVLVLDEPTSALDAESERIIHRSLEALRGKVLVLVIAHRATTLELCDRVVRLEGGHVVDVLECSTRGGETGSGEAREA